MFDATNKFLDANLEIEILDQLYNTQSEKELFFKTMIIFLATNLEVFAEEIVEEYIYELELLSPHPSDINNVLIYESLSSIINESLICKVKQKKESAIEDIVNAAKYLDENTPITNFEINTKFNYGKHGENEFSKLFKRINLNVFETCKIFKSQESLLSDEPELIEINIQNNIGTITRVRNLLLHENKISTEIDIDSFKAINSNFNDFVVKIDEQLKNSLENIRLRVSLRN